MSASSEETIPYMEFKDLPDTTTPVSAIPLNEVQKLIKEDIKNASNTLNGKISETDTKLANLETNVSNANEQINNIVFEILSFTDWIVKKYANGYVEMFYKKSRTCDFTNSYANRTYHSALETVNYPIELKEIYCVTSGICESERLPSINLNSYNLTKLDYFMNDDQSITNANVTVFFSIIGRWK